MVIKCVVYDCDGVLFDSIEANRRLYDHIAVSVGRSPLTEEELHYCHIHTVHESIRCLFKDDPEGQERAREFLSRHIDFKDFIPYLKMEPHLRETLSILRERRIMTAICTNRTTSMPHIMERFSLSPYFDMVVTALDVVRPKPDPESLDKILKVLEVSPREVLYLGDSEVDLRTAESSGVVFAAYKNKAISTGIVIEDHHEILMFLSNVEHGENGENGDSPQQRPSSSQA